MTKKIEKLTPEQEAALVEFRQRMWAQGTSCAPFDRKTAESAITEAYAEIGRPKPVFFWMPSPMSSSLALYVLKKFAHDAERKMLQTPAGLGDGLRAGLGAGLGDGLWGQHSSVIQSAVSDSQTYWCGQMDSFWLAFYRFGTNLGVKQETDLLRRLDIMERIAASIGFWYPRDGICIVSDRFAEVHWSEARNRQGLPFRLHHEERPAVAFRDGWGLYYWHGYRLPPSKEWIIAEKSRITPDLIDDEGNAELRRIMLEVFGFEKYIAVRGAKEIASDEMFGRQRRLLSMTVRGEEIRVLDVWNGSLEPDGTRRRFFLGAMRGANTPHEAAALSYGIDPRIYSEGTRT